VTPYLELTNDLFGVEYDLTPYEDMHEDWFFWSTRMRGLHTLRVDAVWTPTYLEDVLENR